MKTILDNNQRRFHIQSRGHSSIDIFCNLADIPKVLKTAFEKHDEFLIYEFWNRAWKRCTKKHINEMFEANKIDYRVK